MGNSSRQSRAIRQVLRRMNIKRLNMWKLSITYHMLKHSLGLLWFDARELALGMGKPKRLVAEKPSRRL